MRLLLVEDDADTREVLGQVLEALGYEVRLAQNGLDALKAMDQFEPSVALIDLGMPVMNGYELASRIRQDDRFSATKLVALSGYEAGAEASNAPFDFRLLKPPHIDRLDQLLHEIGGDVPTASPPA